MSKNSILIVGVTILILLGSCSPVTTTQTPVPTTAVPVLSIPTPTTQQSIDSVSEISGFIGELALQDQFSGVVLIGRGDKVLWSSAYGLADRESNIPNSLETQFNIGSMNKMFTAVAILQMMERGLLNVDDTIAMHLPDYTNAEAANQITIHQLLTHTSGLGDTFTEQYNADPHQFRSNEDYLPLFVNKPLQFSPGQQFSYSNAGYVVLGLIIEALSEQSYDDYVHQNIFEPSGMANTGAYDIEDVTPNLAIGYTTQDILSNETGVLTRNTAMMPGKGFAAGGGYATAEDLFRFHNALFGYQLLNPASTDLLITGKVEVRGDSRYAYGFFDRVEAGYRMVGHSGGAPGVCSFMNIYPETGYTVIVLTNSDRNCLDVLGYLSDNPLE